jgi:hypothetical protein
MQKILFTSLTLIIMIASAGCNSSDTQNKKDKENNSTQGYAPLSDSDKVLTLPLVRESDFEQ